MSEDTDTTGRALYDVARETMIERNMPPWDEQTSDVREAWERVAKRINEDRVSPKEDRVAAKISEPNPTIVQRDAVRSSTENHHHSGSNLEAIMARISAEVTADAAEKKKTK